MEFNLYMNKLYCCKCNSWTAEWKLNQIKTEIKKIIKSYGIDYPVPNYVWKCWYCGHYNIFKLKIRKKENNDYVLEAKNLEV